MRCSPSLVVVVLLVLAGCGGGAGGLPGAGSTGQSFDPPSPVNLLPLSIRIMTPPVGAYVANDTSLTITGVTTGQVNSITWTNAAGGTGTWSPGVDFGGEIPLQFGDNLITVMAVGQNQIAVDAMIVRNDPLGVDVFSQTVSNGPISIDINNPIDTSVYLSSIALQQRALDRYGLSAASNGHSAAADDALALLLADPSVDSAGFGANGSIWIIYTAGFMGSLTLS